MVLWNKDRRTFFRGQIDWWASQEDIDAPPFCHHNPSNQMDANPMLLIHHLGIKSHCDRMYYHGLLSGCCFALSENGSSNSKGAVEEQILLQCTGSHRKYRGKKWGVELANHIKGSHSHWGADMQKKNARSVWHREPPVLRCSSVAGTNATQRCSTSSRSTCAHAHAHAFFQWENSRFSPFPATSTKPDTARSTSKTNKHESKEFPKLSAIFSLSLSLWFKHFLDL